MPRMPVLAFSAALVAATAFPAFAEDAASFMQRFSGTWIGTGQFLVGSENIEFACELNGDPSETRLTFGMAGRCRMGAMSAPINAELRYNSDTDRYYGQFMGGAEGDGVDLVGARDGEGFSLKLVRGSTQGRLAAETIGEDQMKVVIYYKDMSTNNEFPVVAMGFTKRDVITGSVAP